jgi:predicted neuraminidase
LTGVVIVFAHGPTHAEPLPDLALQPARVIAELGLDYVKSARGSQGVCAIERTAKGRLWAAWYAAKSKTGVESPSSYVVLATSGDDGTSWAEKLVLQAPRLCHTYDPCLWIDPSGKLWFFWAQSAGLQDGRMGVWCMTTKQADVEMPVWSEPRRIANGIMLNKPTVLKNGAWLLTVGLLRDSKTVPNIPFDDKEIAPYTIAALAHDLGAERGSNVFRSTDAGRTFERIGQVRIPGTAVDEHMIVERRDGSLWMLVRHTDGIAQSVSTDGGRTWNNGPMFLTLRETASSRFFLRRLSSGALLLIRNAPPSGRARSHLTAFLSDDDGATWTGGLLLDERACSYPDATIAADGTIRVIYDHQRYTDRGPDNKGVGAVMMAVLREEDVRAGKTVGADSRLHIVVSQLQPAH